MDGGKSTNVLYNSERLKKLLTNLYLIAGIQTNIYDTNGVDTQLFGNHADFCRVINSTEAGHARCLKCDSEGVRRCAQTRKPYRYRCHAGLWEVIIPIFDSGEPVAFIAFGQLLDDSSYREQWAHTLSTLSWCSHCAPAARPPRPPNRPPPQRKRPRQKPPQKKPPLLMRSRSTLSSASTATTRRTGSLARA